ncbi:low temperature requirement protein A, partial [Streptococcus mutans]|nr:low temperature requirement protein A [Streptococcus mutans]
MSQFLSKRVSNYELFFDLAVVLAIGQLTSAIHLNHIGLQEVLAFITTNIIIFNIW